MKSNEKARWFKIVWGFVMFFLLFFERIFLDGQSYSIWSIGIAMKRGEGYGGRHNGKDK